MSLLSRLPAEPLRLINYHLACSSSQRYLATTTPRSLDKKAYSHTLRLPNTHVPLKHKNPVAIEDSLRSRLSDELYRWQRDRPGPPFVFLDGPPYANGNLHMGHALNKVLKDFINRYRVLRGHRVHFEPGWDCHGLPIEQKALASAKITHTKAEPTKIRAIARKTALKAIEVQKKEMRDLGVMADWDNDKTTYRTLDHDYQIRQLRLFEKMVDLGHIRHRLKPTYYSPKSRTALAESELKYMDDHVSQSVYVTFDVQPEDMSAGLKAAWEVVKADQESLKLGIWTTTPWTLVSNLGVAVRNDLTYVLTRTAAGQLLVLQHERVEPMKEIIGDIEVLSNLQGADLIGTRYTHLFHPVTSSRPRPRIMHASHVTTESGTGLVHMAPVHGHEDYAAFLAAGASPEDMQCAVDDDGRFISSLSEHLDVDHAILDQIIGKEVLGDAVPTVIELLRRDGTLLAQQELKHRYPYDWKSKTPVIIRATPQWFADVGAVKDNAASAVEQIDFYPQISRHRLNAFVSSRSEWCISRQRSWGVPIPVLFNSKDEPMADPAYLNHAIDVLETKGIEHWWTGPVEDFIPPNASEMEDLRKGGDTLDVWFDSGSAWTSIPELAPADVVLEGSDQHRGWFQSTLLTKLMTTENATPAAKKIITHGFITDEKGQKMSKSDGNGISPMDIIHGSKGKPALGADVLRTWVASVDYSKDVSLGPSSITQASEQLRKLRSVMRFALGNVASVPEASPKLGILDRYVLNELAQLERSVSDAYEQFAFSRALQSVNGFASATLSALYYDVNKDTLYSDDVASPRRQAVVHTLHQVLTSLLRLVAPILPHLAEELNQALPKPFAPTVFAGGWPETFREGYDEVESAVSDLLSLRAQLQALVGQCHMDKLLKTSSEVDVWISGTGRVVEHMRAHERALPALFGSASVTLGPAPESVAWSRSQNVEQNESSVLVTVTPSGRHQCPRCWLHQADEAASLCKRCVESVAKMGGA